MNPSAQSLHSNHQRAATGFLTDLVSEKRHVAVLLLAILVVPTQAFADRLRGVDANTSIIRGLNIFTTEWDHPKGTPVCEVIDCAARQAAREKAYEENKKRWEAEQHQRSRSNFLDEIMRNSLYFRGFK
ncbi:hypothetical protein [Lysobacter antibioticus]|uniref:hypothetical protein n=1 Tax=Lysobacter antibioticus TaxID=84531 RepID=UPI001269E74D|nr:hypothetical protein [Lysobacter antibioticus]